MSGTSGMDDESTQVVVCRLAKQPDRAVLIATLSHVGFVLDLGDSGIRLIPFERHFPTTYFTNDGEIKIVIHTSYLDEVNRMLLEIARQLETTIVWPGSTEPVSRGRAQSEAVPPASKPTRESDM